MKHYADRAMAQEAFRRSADLRAAGVSTPAVIGRPGDQALCFGGVDGNTGIALVADDLAPLLTVVARLHSASLRDLPVYDPFLRVRPRLAFSTQLPVSEILSEPVPSGNATLHGDLHVGQFIRDGDGKVWVVDLDDLAIGPREADLANFAAHLATSLPERSIADWSDRVCGAWTRIGETVDREIFTRFLRFALLRRHLKLREAGRPDFEAEIGDYLRGNSNFSIL